MSSPIINDPNSVVGAPAPETNYINLESELLDFIRVYNMSIALKLASLNAAMKVGSAAETNLSDVENMRNIATGTRDVPTFEEWAKDWDTSTDPPTYAPGQGFDFNKEYKNEAEYQRKYNEASAAYDKWLAQPENSAVYFGYDGVMWTPDSPEYQDWANQMTIYRQNLIDIQEELGSQLTDEQKADPSGLYSKLGQVIDSMPSDPDPVASFEAWQSWVTDGWGADGTQLSGGGKVQNSLDGAIRASQSFLNTTQMDMQQALMEAGLSQEISAAIVKALHEAIMAMARGVK